MNYNYHKMEFRDESKEQQQQQQQQGSTRGSEDGKGDAASRMYYGCRSDAEESEMKSPHSVGKDGPAISKPGDVKNGDLVSLLLAATPPYLYNIPLIPQTFFFSEMLKSFVQAKTERQSMKSHQTHHKRQRKRAWREMTPPKAVYYESSDKPLELTTPKQTETKDKPPKRCQFDGHKYSSDLGASSSSGSGTGSSGSTSSTSSSSNFTAEKLANSSITNTGMSESVGVGSDLLPPTPPLWYPPLYPPHPPFGIDPLHFFIDLRVSAHVWDKKLAADRLADPSSSPLNLRQEATTDATLARSRHKSAFSVPAPRKDACDDEAARKRSRHSVHYLMSNLRNIFKPRGVVAKKENDDDDDEEAVARAKAAYDVDADDDDDDDGDDDDDDKTKGDAANDDDNDDEAKKKKKKCRDLRALIGLELVVDYVKHESDGSDDEDQAEAINVEQLPEERALSA